MYLGRVLRFKIFGGGDYSAGIPDVDAEVTITENVISFSKEEIKRWREMLAEMYDISTAFVWTFEEWNKKVVLENEYFKEE